MRKLLATLFALCVATTAHATNYSGFARTPTDSSVQILEANKAQPAYRVKEKDPVFNVKTTRVGGDQGYGMATTSGQSYTWGLQARHHYSKDQPWNADQTLLGIEAIGSGASCGSAATVLISTGDNYSPYRSINCPGLTNWGSSSHRWCRRVEHANWAVGIFDSAGSTWIDTRDVLTCKRVRLAARLGDSLSGSRWGESEGHLSNNDRWMVIGKTETNSDGTAEGKLTCAVVDLENAVVGPVHIFGQGAASVPENSATVSRVYPDSSMGHFSILPSGGGMSIKFRGAFSSNNTEPHKIFDIDTTGTPWGAISARSFAIGPSGGSGVYHHSAVANSAGTDTIAGTRGMITGLKHEDYIWDPDSTADFAVGINRSGQSATGCDIVAVNCKTGYAKCMLSDPTVAGKVRTAEPLHVSAQNYRRPGWAYVSGATSTSSDTSGSAGHSKLFYDEIFAVKIHGRNIVQRFAHSHGIRNCSNNAYRTEPQASVSPDGTKVIYASNFQRFNSGTPPSTDMRQAYVMDLACTAPHDILTFHSNLSTDQTTTTIRVRWTEPGVDSLEVDPPRLIEIRYSTSPLTPENFSSGTLWSPTPSIVTYGTENNVLLTGLTADTQYYIGIREASECDDYSAPTVICVYTKHASNPQQECGDEITARGRKPGVPNPVTQPICPTGCTRSGELCLCDPFD